MSVTTDKITNALELGTKFLRELDNFLANRFSGLKCNDICSIYSRFWNDLKEFKGNSSGFTGLSEYLIFRFLYHQLGGSFEPKKATNVLQKFVHNEFQIGQSIPVSIDNKKRYPDVTIYQNHELMAIIQIKVYLTNGSQEIKKEVELLQKLKQKHSKLTALLLIYFAPSRKGKVFRELIRARDNNDFFDFVILEENDELLAEKLRISLALDRLSIASLSSD